MSTTEPESGGAAPPLLSARAVAWARRNARWLVPGWAGLWLLSFGSMPSWTDDNGWRGTVGGLGLIATVLTTPFALYGVGQLWEDGRATEFGARVEGFFDRWGWSLAWFGGGAVSFGIAVSSVLLGAPTFKDSLLPSLLFTFGAFSVSTALSLAVSKLHAIAADRPPRESLYPGQFWFAFLAMVVLSATMCALLVAAFISSATFADALGKDYPAWKVVILWAVGILFGLVALWAVAMPFSAMFGWFRLRRSLQTMRDDALFKLAGVAPSKSAPPVDEDSGDDD